ncbi:MAG TPA: hypothetical protein VNO24_17455 [Blastocatellia bacterium]|nr:hypothetical protein [Blastocatellia bacterium]
MRFEARELMPYGEPVSATELQEGSIYFAVTFVDEDMLIPTMETLVFVGRNLETGDIGKVYFQDVHSYRAGIRYGPDAEDEWAEFQTASEDSVNHIFEYEPALDQLLRCSLRRGEVA